MNPSRPPLKLIRSDEVFDTAVSKTEEEIGSRLVAALESCYNTIRQRYAEGIEIREYRRSDPKIGHIPPAVIVISSMPLKLRGNVIETKYGHFAKSRWNVDGRMLPEIMVSAEGLRREPRDVLGTLIHEAVHGACFDAGVQDVSRQDRYHNVVFRRAAEEIGLVVHEPMKTLGHSNTELPHGEHDDLVEELGPKLVAWREFDDTISLPEEHERWEVSLRCLCQPQRKIRIYRNIWDRGPVMCSVCETSFEEGY